ncbi:hypothetical protein IC229_21200 [Spirosoma sp. BT702]|uniref:Uncharacterized protein n=1 Tax=Spirosoma profusum TaxID=2771354 RepID=A0A926XYM2_9BACT|nr:hypothetical protein [Spirosoma profusum]MBD2703177.1 hypothetical protein [Spirosoma profusum]
MEGFTDDLMIPAETKIYYSKGKNLFKLVASAVFLFSGIIILMQKDYLLSAIFLAAGGFLIYLSLKRVANQRAQIILNAKGIWTVSAQFNAWRDISHENVYQEGKLSNYRKYLYYEYPPHKQENLSIDDYNIDQAELKRLLHIYRGRSMNEQT